MKTIDRINRIAAAQVHYQPETSEEMQLIINELVARLFAAREIVKTHPNEVARAKGLNATDLRERFKTMKRARSTDMGEK